MNALTNKDLKYLQAITHINMKRVDNILNEKGLAKEVKAIYRKEYKLANAMYEKLSRNITPDF
jgi:hypothetical protein